MGNHRSSRTRRHIRRQNRESSGRPKTKNERFCSFVKPKQRRKLFPHRQGEDGAIKIAKSLRLQFQKTGKMEASRRETTDPPTLQPNLGRQRPLSCENDSCV